MRHLDLTPFGFTPTESAAYGALLERGPSSGYALAQALAIARANAYQALNGLVAKGAAMSTDGPPRVFRAVGPAALLALVTTRQADELDALEAAMAAAGGTGAPAIIEFAGERAFRDLTLRTATRSEGTVVCAAPAALLTSSIPVWRKRHADGNPTALWSVGGEPKAFPLPLAGAVPATRIREYFGADAALVLAPEAGIVATLEAGEIGGYWCSHPALLGTLRAAVDAITAG